MRSTRWPLVVLSLALALPVAISSGCGSSGAGGEEADAAAVTDGTPPDGYQKCGDGFVQGNEQCDDGNDWDGDDCKSDCTLACGDGVVNETEKCDSGIAARDVGACPTACDNSDACVVQVLSGDGCQSECLVSNITDFVDSDGCCPASGDNTLDSDCPVKCGNGVQESGELCDTAITAGMTGACPVAADCVDTFACTTNELVDGGTCQAVCNNADITTPANDDGCCPLGATLANDNDCNASCGDGVVTPSDNETCDTAIAAGMTGACPLLADCVTADPCIPDTLIAGGTCTATCDTTLITTIGLADSCCPSGANANTDSDCNPKCPNGVVESGEECDDNNAVNGDGCDSMCKKEIVASAFRINTLVLRDPHAYTNIVIFCSDITSNLNDEFAASVRTDSDGDGFLGLSIVTEFTPHAPTATSTPLEIVFPDCTDPLATTTCTRNAANSAPVDSNANNQATGTCLSPLANTVRPYNPAVTNSTGPCFASDTETLALVMGGIPITLTDTTIAGTYVSDTGIVNGLIRGFLTEAEADATILPMDISVVGGKRLSEILRGGTGNCKSGTDMDNNGGVPGWWMYFNYTADPVTLN